nr:hypothetical protein [Brevundimonas diminuta]
MHIRFNRSLRGDYGRARAGDVKLVEPEVGKSLVKRGLAVEVDEKAAAEAAAKAEAKAKDAVVKGRGKPAEAAAKAD